MFAMECSEVYIKASSKERPFTIREVKASYIGQLVRISGIVTRCSDVKPLMQVAVYTCEDCGFEIYQVTFVLGTLKPILIPQSLATCMNCDVLIQLL